MTLLNFLLNVKIAKSSSFGANLMYEYKESFVGKLMEAIIHILFLIILLNSEYGLYHLFGKVEIHKAFFIYLLFSPVVSIIFTALVLGLPLYVAEKLKAFLNNEE